MKSLYLPLPGPGRSPVEKLRLWLQWMLLPIGVAAVFLVMMIGLFLTLEAVFPAFNGDRIGDGIYPIFIFLLTLSQAWVLRKITAKAWQWLLYSAVGWTAGLLTLALLKRVAHNTLYEQAAPFFILGFGLLVGATQWLFLRRRFHRSWSWVLASMLSWGLVSLLPGAAFNTGLGGILLALAPGSFTGALLAWGMRSIAPGEGA